MIAQFKTMTRWSAATAAVVFTLGLVTLTDVQTDKVAQPARIFGTNGPTVKTLLSGTGDETFGILAPDESAVIYSHWHDKGGDLMLRDLRTGAIKTLVKAGTDGHYEFSNGWAWSPDSKSVAYNWERIEDTISIRVISRDGGEPKVV